MTDSEELHAAVESGDLDNVRRVLDQGASLADAVSPFGWPLLHVAALRGHLEVARLLWERDPSQERRRLKRALHFGLQSGNRELVRFFVEQGAVESPAMKSLYLGELEELRRWVGGMERQEVDAADEDGQTLLHVAAEVRSPAAVELLLGAGAAVGTHDRRGLTPLAVAVQSIWRQHAPEVVDLLLGHGAPLDVSSACVLGRASELAALLRDGKESDLARLMGAAQEAGHGHVGRVLVRAGAALDVFGAASFGPRTALEEILAADPGAIGRQRSSGNYQPLHCAAEVGQLENVRLLLERGADPEGKNGWGFRPLHLSVLGARGYPTTDAHLEISRLLLDRGADVDAADDLERTPLDLALHAAERKRWHSPSMALWRRLNPEGLAGIHDDRTAEILALLRARGARGS